MKMSILSCLSFFIATVVAVWAQHGRVIHFSPDEQLQAVVTPVTQDGSEHRIEIRSADGKRIAMNDHSSGDHEHGHGVIHAAWTPDSRFFVYSVSSSGGHSAWHFPTHVFVKERNAFFNLDKACRHSFTTPQFLLSAPNKFHSERLDPGSGDEPQNVPADFHLQDIPWPKNP